MFLSPLPIQAQRSQRATWSCQRCLPKDGRIYRNVLQFFLFSILFSTIPQSNMSGQETLPASELDRELLSAKLSAFGLMAQAHLGKLGLTNNDWALGPDSEAPQRGAEDAVVCLSADCGQSDSDDLDGLNDVDDLDDLDAWFMLRPTIPGIVAA